MSMPNRVWTSLDVGNFDADEVLTSLGVDNFEAEWNQDWGLRREADALVQFRE